MELALNLVWVCVAIAGIGLLCESLSSSEAVPGQSSGKWQKIMAMSCALIILFFVISMTDDLHDQEIVVEDNKSLRIISASVISAPSITCHKISTIFPMNSAFASLALALPSARRLVVSPKLIPARETLCQRLYGRAPPASIA